MHFFGANPLVFQPFQSPTLASGFNFELLLRRRPELRESLTELRERLVRDSDSLRTGEDDSEDIKVWQLQVRPRPPSPTLWCGGGCDQAARCLGPRRGGGLR